MVLYACCQRKVRGEGRILVLQLRAKPQKAVWVIKIIQRLCITFREAQTFSSTALRFSCLATDTELINCNEESPSWEANIFSVWPRYSLQLTEHEGSLPLSQQPVAIPYPEPHQSSRGPSPIFRMSVVILPSNLTCWSSMITFSPGYFAKTLHVPPKLICILNVGRPSLFSSSSPYPKSVHCECAAFYFRLHSSKGKK